MASQHSIARANIASAGIARARTAEGYELPIIDVRHPAFAIEDGPEAVERLRETNEAEQREQRRMPKFLLRFFMSLAARRSLLIRALFNPEAGYLGGINTYAMKLGPKNLAPPFDSEFDRRLVASAPATSMRLRLQQVATLIAEALEPMLLAEDAPLHLLDIGGGPAMDSLNALMILVSKEPRLLGREITIHVLDLEPGGAIFGRNALKALRAEGGPLAGLPIRLVHRPYDWRDTGPLQQLLGELAATPAIIGASSEGALFEYGDDDTVLRNLRALRAGGARFVAGSVSRADATARRMQGEVRVKLVPRGAEGFRPLAEAAGFRLERTKPALLSDQVLLTPA